MIRTRLGLYSAMALIVAPAALADPSAGGNPIPLTEASLEQLFRAVGAAPDGHQHTVVLRSFRRITTFE